MAISQNMAISTKLALRNIFRNPKRSLITIFAVALGLWSSTALSSLARGVSNRLAEDAIHNLTGHIQIHSPQYLNDPTIENSHIKQDHRLIAAIKSLAPRAYALRVRVPAIIASERESAAVTLLGIDPKQEEKLSFIGDVPMEGSGLQGGQGIIIGKKMAETLETALGRRVVIMSQDRDNKVADRGLRVVGVYDAPLDSTEKNYVFVTRSVAQEFLGMAEELSEVSILTESREGLELAVETLGKIGADIEVKTWREIEPFSATLLKVQSGFLRLWFMIVVIAVSLGLINTLFMSIFERTREIGLVMALGLQSKFMIVEIMIESFCLLISGAIFGNILGLITLQLLHNGIDISSFAKAAQMVGLRSIIIPFFRLDDWILINVLVLIIGVCASFYPAYKASRFTPIEALRKV